MGKISAGKLPKKRKHPARAVLQKPQRQKGKFGPEQLQELWENGSKRDFYKAIIERGLVRGTPHKPKHEKSRSPKTWITARGQKLCIASTGRRSRTLNLNIDFDFGPLPSKEEMRLNPNWWSKLRCAPRLRQYLQREAAKLSIESPAPVHYRVLKKALNRAGFAEELFIGRLEEELGYNLLNQLCKDLFLFTDREANAYTDPVIVKANGERVTIPYGPPLKGEFRIQPDRNQLMEKIAVPLNSKKRIHKVKQKSNT